MQLFFLYMSSLFLFTTHADGLAEFTYTLDQNHILLKFEMDNAELQPYRINMDCPEETMSDLCIANYLKMNSDLEINGEPVVFQLEGSSIHNDHVIFYLKSDKTYQDIKNLRVQNDCFYAVNSKFKNRVRIDISEHQKSFLLTKGKQVIHLK